MLTHAAGTVIVSLPLWAGAARAALTVIGRR
jgi:hypothetical protein